MKVAFRVDSSLEIGSGHLMRCLTLARSLSEKGTGIFFICRDLDGNISRLVEDAGFNLCLLDNKKEVLCPNSIGYEKWLGTHWSIDSHDTQEALKQTGVVDWIIVDHYALDKNWETQLREYAKGIFIIDDLANRPHDCNILLDQNFYSDPDNRYIGLVYTNTKLLLGPSFALLRKEFKMQRELLRERDGSIKNIMVFFGLNDNTNETQKTLQALLSAKTEGIEMNIILGTNNPNKDKIEQISNGHSNIKCLSKVTNMSELMSKADLFIGAGGTTTFERCCLGLPSLVITVAENQVKAIKDMHEAGFLHYLGYTAKVSEQHILDTINHLLNNADQLKKYSEKASSLVDGSGTEKCTDIILNFHKRDN